KPRFGGAFERFPMSGRSLRELINRHFAVRESYGYFQRATFGSDVFPQGFDIGVGKPDPFRYLFVTKFFMGSQAALAGRKNVLPRCLYLFFMKIFFGKACSEAITHISTRAYRLLRHGFYRSVVYRGSV
ncbi:hypothetical protein, partial [Pseudomonas syringae]|uniref:hypothetical protein n=1 Tax=Pseudomonas syringae TaxID=317 RepID=UPI002D219704